MPLTPEDLRQLPPMPHHQTPWEQTLEVLFDHFGETYAGTLWHEAEPLACMGVVPSPTGYVCWVLLGESAPRHMIALTRTARRHLRHLVSCGVEPLVAHTDDERGERWLRMIGFRPDGTEEYGMRRLLFHGERG